MARSRKAHQTPAPPDHGREHPRDKPDPAPPASPTDDLLADDRPFPHQRRWFWGLLALAVVTRAILLILSQRYPSADEATVGVMALDILAGKPIPFFLYGQQYGGGHVVEALLAAPWFGLFGPQDLVLNGVPAALSCLLLVVVYGLLYRFFSKRLALLTLAVAAGCCLFISSSFLVSGFNTTQLFTWAGLYFFFCHFYGDPPRLHHLALAGACLGFGIYCYDYPVVFIAAILGLMAWRHRLDCWRRWKEFVALVLGVLAGVAPLIVYDLRHHVNHLQRFTGSGSPGQSSPFAFVRKAWQLLFHDFPGSFRKELRVFPDTIGWTSWLPWLVFCAAIVYLLVARREPLARSLRALFSNRPPAGGRELRLFIFLYFFMAYAAVYCLSESGGQSPRFILPFYPFIPILFAWAVLRLGRARRGWAILAAILFVAPQLWQVVRLARDKTIDDWGVVLHGEDIKKVVHFLEERRLNAVLAPYEIKWNLMFYSNRRIAVAANIFGNDRELVSSNRALHQLNELKAPLAIVLDKDLRLLQVPRLINPGAACFDLTGFLDNLKQEGIRYQLTPIGDYVVFHDFSEHFKLSITNETPPAG